jgi:para-nitrobenzyl esterase
VGEYPHKPPQNTGATIEYVFETVKSQNVPWTTEDFKLSDIMSTYCTNFAKKGDPNGGSLPDWPPCEPNNSYHAMHLCGTAPHSFAETNRERYEFLDAEAT